MAFDQRVHDFDAMSVIAAHLRENPADPFSGRQCEELVIDARDRLYASPVVPVGVSREEIARIIEPELWEGWDWQEDDQRVALAKADAIIAALRPTDTGRE